MVLRPPTTNSQGVVEGSGLTLIATARSLWVHEFGIFPRFSSLQVLFLVTAGSLPTQDVTYFFTCMPFLFCLLVQRCPTETVYESLWRWASLFSGFQSFVQEGQPPFWGGTPSKQTSNPNGRPTMPSPSAVFHLPPLTHCLWPRKIGQIKL